MTETEPDISNKNKISIDNIWASTKGDTVNWGIDGYEAPKQYFDHLKAKEGKVLWEKINNKKIVPNWPPKLPRDSTDKLIWPKRPNFIDDVN